jgi:triacylglycerol lipase
MRTDRIAAIWPVREPGAQPAFDPRPPQAPPQRRPRWWGNHVAELRWQLELYRLLADPIFRGSGVAHGDGRPLLLLPGFGAGDYTLAVMGLWLKRIGYSPHGAGFIVNTGCSDEGIQRIERQVGQLHERYGRRVALIGHSRGGHYARAMARRRPDLVSHAIALGANLRQMLGISFPTQGVVALARTVQRLPARRGTPGCLTETCTCSFANDFSRPFPEHLVRLTSVYSKEDGVVRWQGCVVPYGECVEITGSHVGMIFNRKAYRAIAHALSMPELQP